MPTELVEYKRGRERGNAHRPLTRSLDSTKEGLEVNSTQNGKSCSLEGCNEKHHAHGYCGPHAYRFKKYGSPTVDGPGRRAGRNRLSVPGYAGVHKRLNRDIGPARERTCVDCGSCAEEWSYDGGCPNEVKATWGGSILSYSADMSRYSPRCRRCHRRRDESLSRDRDSLGRFASASDEQTGVMLVAHEVGAVTP